MPTVGLAVGVNSQLGATGLCGIPAPFNNSLVAARCFPCSTTPLPPATPAPSMSSASDSESDMEPDAIALNMVPWLGFLVGFEQTWIF